MVPSSWYKMLSSTTTEGFEGEIVVLGATVLSAGETTCLCSEAGGSSGLTVSVFVLTCRLTGALVAHSIAGGGAGVLSKTGALAPLVVLGGDGPVAGDATEVRSGGVGVISFLIGVQDGVTSVVVGEVWIGFTTEGTFGASGSMREGAEGLVMTVEKDGDGQRRLDEE